MVLYIAPGSAVAEWNNAKLAKGNLADESNTLKNQSGGDIIVYGGSGFVASLIERNLIDEYDLLVNPVAIGKSASIFGELQETLRLRLLKTRQFSCGTVLLCYEPSR